MAYNDNSMNRDVILNYAFSTYGTEPEYPWESSPDNEKRISAGLSYEQGQVDKYSS